jgi:hypothetical protein
VNEIELLKRLGDRARDEADLPIEVSRQVFQRLRTRQVRRVDSKLAFASLAACSFAIAAVIGTLFWAPAGDSVAALSEMVTMGGEPEVLLRLLEP